MITHSPLPASYSRLNLFERCALQYKFRYVDKLPQPKAAQAQRGTDMHASIEGYLLGHKTTLHRAVLPIAELVQKIKGKSPLVEHKLCFTEAFKEVVDWDSKKGWFRMVLDCLYYRKNKAYVQEWKSGKEYDDHADQRTLYGLGAILGKPDIEYAQVTTYYIDLDKKQPLQVTMEGAMLTAKRLTARVIRLQEEEYYAPRTGNYCRWCPYSRNKGGPCTVA